MGDESVGKVVIHRRVLTADGATIETQTLQVTDTAQITDITALLARGGDEVEYFHWSPSVPNDHLILYDEGGVQLREVRVWDGSILRDSDGRNYVAMAGYRERINALLTGVPVEGRPVGAPSTRFPTRSETLRVIEVLRSFEARASSPELAEIFVRVRKQLEEEASQMPDDEQGAGS